jgi:hypothetical protein
MYSLLLKKALPFALTFILGSLVGGLFQKSRAVFSGSFVLRDEAPDLSMGRAPHGRSGCKRARSLYLVAESRPLLIIFKPDARLPREFSGLTKDGLESALVSVTFGADGKIQNAALSRDWLFARTGGMSDANTTAEIMAVSHAAERAARQIQFAPETINSVPVTVTREVDIRFMDE